MSTRIWQTAISFSMVLGAFVVYRIAAAPFIEPAASIREAETAKLVDSTPASSINDRDAELLNAIFPPGAWQREDPIILKSDRAMLLMRDYRNLESGEVELQPFSMVFFPNGDQTVDENLIRRAVVLQAPQGAVLKFDEPVDLRRAKIGRLIGGHMDGPITVRGNPNGYQGQDEIFAETRDLKLSEDRMFTTAPVSFRIGPNRGQGREMNIKLGQDAGGGGRRGAAMGRIESLELLHDVSMHLVSGRQGLLPGDHPATARQTSAGQNPAGQNSSSPVATGLTPIALSGDQRGTALQPAAGHNPTTLVPLVPRESLTGRSAQASPDGVDITCQGPFKFNWVDNEATFKDQVNIVRPVTGGTADQGTCEQLTVRFAQKQSPPTDSTKPSASPTPLDQRGDTSNRVANGASEADAKPRRSGSNLEPRSVEMLGRPAILRALSRNAFAEGQRIDYDILTGRVLVESDREITLRQAGSEIHAQRIIYQPAPAGRLGRLLAAGPGWLKGISPSNPEQTWEAQWKNELRIRPHEGQQVISLLGGGRLRMGELAEMRSDEIYFWLNEVPFAGPANAGHSAAATPFSQDRSSPPSFELPNSNDSFAGSAAGQLITDSGQPQAFPGGRTSDAGATPVRNVPDKLLCRGNVTVHSPQVDAATDRLEMWFKPIASSRGIGEGAERRSGISVQPVGLPGGRAVGGSGVGGTGVGGTGVGGNDIPLMSPPANGSPGTTPVLSRVNNSPPPVAAFTNPPPPAIGRPNFANGVVPPAQPLAAIRSNALPQQHFDARGKLIRLQALLLDQRIILDDVTIEGDARLDETQTANRLDRPLHLAGDQLQILGAAGNQSIAKVKGKPGVVDARGLTLSGEVVQLDRGRSRLWIDGPGTMQLPMDRTLDGRPLAAPRPLEITWQGKMNFDGLTMQFEKGIDAHSELQSLKTEFLGVTVAKKIDFLQSNPQDRPQIASISCQGGVLLENRSVEGQTTTSWDRMQTKDLSINQISGVLQARGPGWFTSVRVGSSAATPLAPPGPPHAPAGANPPPVDNSREVGLQYLNVQFLREITGNIHQRDLTFREQVRTVYGPVKDWKDELNSDRIENLGPRGALLTCDSLRVTEMPSRPPARGSVELDARENVMIEAQTFTARAARLSYAQSKDLVVLEGDGRSDAQLFRQQTVGGPTANAAAKKILYWRGTNRVELDDARFLDLGQLSGGSFGPRPTAVAPNPVPRPRTP